MNMKKPYGKGLSGFMLGLLLATAVIAAIVFFINKNNEKAFKKEESAELPKPEILTPKSSGTATPPAQNTGGDLVQASEPADILETQTASEMAEATETPGDTVSEPKIEPQAEIKEEQKPQTPPAVQSKPKSESKPVQEAKKPEQKKTDVKQAEKKETTKKTAKPSPEQILESGSIEKARTDAAKKEAAQKAEARKHDNGETGRIVLQMGSFNNRDSAEAHRAKLAMMGISGSVVEGEANGKRVYRVQSGKMNKETAGRTQQTLKQNGVDSFARTVK